MVKLLTRSAPIASIPVSRYSMLQKTTPMAGKGAQLEPKKAALVGAGPVRHFSSYPEHLVLEMPNLSPTMEKVSC